MSWRRLLVMAVLASGCGGTPQVRVSDVENPAVLEHYLGLMVGGDPYTLGVLSGSDRGYVIDADRLATRRSGLDRLLNRYLDRRHLEWDSLLTFAAAAYDRIRQMPDHVDQLHKDLPADEVLIFEVHGPMTRYLRRITIPKSALHQALNAFSLNRRQLVYPIGTTIVARHLDDSVPVETTAMYKRPDGYWEFGTYDRAGRRVAATHANPRALVTPKQCVGCHLGTRLFEPEKSFPAPAPAGPDGVRHWYTSARDPVVTQLFSEHERRSDTVLGLYATVYVTDLLQARQSGIIAQEEARLLTDLGL